MREKKLKVEIKFTNPIRVNESIKTSAESVCWQISREILK
jgi:hypothetical protein